MCGVCVFFVFDSCFFFFLFSFSDFFSLSFMKNVYGCANQCYQGVMQVSPSAEFHKYMAAVEGNDEKEKEHEIASFPIDVRIEALLNASTLKENLISKDFAWLPWL